jgi:DNA-binding transcriptional MerR regulator
MDFQDGFLDWNDDHVDVLLTIDQVATQLGVSQQTIRNWDAQGKLVPAERTAAGHRRYSQQTITNLKRKHKDFEILMKVKSSKILTGVQQILASFREDEEITVGIRSDFLNRQVQFTFDSEDGLQTYTKTFKMEE